MNKVGRIDFYFKNGDIRVNCVDNDVDWKPLLSEYDEVEIMQFTGLLDKNGKDIYEGDIVKIAPNDGVNIGLTEKINWVDQTKWIGGKCPVNGFVNHESIYKVKPEVIGNIYENPELSPQYEVKDKE